MKLLDKQIAILNNLILCNICLEDFDSWDLTDAISDIIQSFDFEDVRVGQCSELNSVLFIYKKKQ